MAWTEKKELFKKEYLIDLNATQAAIRTGYSEKTAYSQGQRLLKDVEMAAAIQLELDARSKRTEIDADYVLTRLADIDKMSVKDIMNDDMTLKPLSDWPDVWCQSISAIDVSEMVAGQNDAEAAISFIKKLKWPEAMKTLELMGKHVGVQAFNDKSTISGPNGGPIETRTVFNFIPVGPSDDK